MLSRFALGAALITAAFVPLVNARSAMIAEDVKLPALLVGSDAPSITIAKWLKGTPVTSFEKGKVYIVEFWAPWCGPCVRGMPHLSELQKKYSAQGLTIIGVAWDDWNKNTLELSEKFVASEKGNTMEYTVAWDADSKTNTAYFVAAGQHGIPSAYLVDREGKVAYIGLPSEMDKVVDDVINKKHDIKALAEVYKKQAELDAKADVLKKSYSVAAKAKDWPAALEACDKLIALGGDELMGGVSNKFMLLASKMNETAKAYAFAREIQQGVGKDKSEVLNMLAWMIVDPAGSIEKPDLDLALSLATDADKLEKGKDAGVLDTVARVHFLKGDIKKAIEIQTTAVDLADKRMKASLQKTLDEYKAAAEKKTGG